MSSSHWQNYWDSGIGTTLAAQSGTTYAGAIGEFWQSTFEYLPENGRALEIGAGNAAVARQLCDLCEAHARSADFLATDLCRYPADTIKGNHASLRFRGETAIEQLPVNEGPFQLILSCYALEYAPVEAAIASVSGVADSGAILAALVHGKNSIVTCTAREDVGNAKLIFESGLIEAAIQLCQSVAAGRPTSESDVHKARLDAAMHTLIDAHEREPSQVIEAALHNVQQIFAKGFVADVQRRLRFAQEYGARLADASRRSQDQMDIFARMSSPATHIREAAKQAGWEEISLAALTDTDQTGQEQEMGDALIMRYAPNS